MTLTSNDRRMLATEIVVAASFLIALTLPSAGAANVTARGKKLFEKALQRLPFPRP